MAKKDRRSVAARRAARPVKTPTLKPSTEPVEPLEVTSEEDEGSRDVKESTPARPLPPGMSPLMRSQEIELEVGLTILGAAMGGLTNYGDVAMSAVTGNTMAAVQGALAGALLGYSLGRTLFLSVRTQWISWGILVGLAVIGHAIYGALGMLVGAFVGTLFVLFGGMNDDESADSMPVSPSGTSPVGAAPSNGVNAIPLPPSSDLPTSPKGGTSKPPEKLG